MGVFVTRRPDSQSKGFGDGRRIGGRRTKQTRSYFALKLPHDWWLIGADAQLSGFIDQGQVAFLDNMAQKYGRWVQRDPLRRLAELVICRS